MSDSRPLACKLCLYDLRSVKLPTHPAQLPRYPTEDALRDHWNQCHRDPEDRLWKGTEASWRGIVREARGISEGFVIAYGDYECTYYVLWCLHCDYETSDPLAAIELRCPQCGRNYSGLGANL